MTNADMPTAGRPPKDVQFVRDPQHTDRAAVLADSDYARDLAIEALQNGRLELGVGFANIALRARRHADRMPRRGAGPNMINVPVLGATRDEQPRQRGIQLQCTDEYQPPHTAGSHPDMCTTCSEVREWAAARNGRPVDLLEYRSAHSNVETATTQPPIPPVSSRCQASATTLDRQLCENVIYLEHATGVWRHLNPPLDMDHKAIPREGDGV